MFPRAKVPGPTEPKSRNGLDHWWVNGRPSKDRAGVNTEMGHVLTSALLEMGFMGLLVESLMSSGIPGGGRWGDENNSIIINYY